MQRQRMCPDVAPASGETQFLSTLNENSAVLCETILRGEAA